MSSIGKKIKALLLGINKNTFNIKAINNRIKSLISYTSRRCHTTDIFPGLVHIELTNICNLKCPMCPIPYMKRERGYMEADLFKKIISELSSSPVEAVALSLFGESLLHKKFPEFLRIAKSSGLNVVISTNGLNLSEELSYAIIDNSLDLLIISYDSHDPEVYKNIRCGGNLDTLNYNLEKFLRLKGRRLPVTIIQCIEFPDSEKQIEKVRNRWKSFDVIMATRPAHNWLGDIPEINKITFPQKGKDKDCGICDQSWRHAVIYWDGCVGPCCNLYDAQMTFGNLYNSSLTEIWNGKKIEHFRRKHVTLSRSKIEECHTCGQTAPNFVETIALALFDMATIDMYMVASEGWRDSNI